jgi:hypothetical protein
LGELFEKCSISPSESAGMLLERASRAYWQEAMKAVSEVEKGDYAEANVKRDVLAVSRFIDFLFGEYEGKASTRLSSGGRTRRSPASRVNGRCRETSGPSPRSA